MNKITFDIAREDDLNEIYAMFRAAIADMEQREIHQWNEFYPDRDILRRDIIARQLFAGKIDGKIVCAYVLNNDCDSDYNLGDWKYSRQYAKIVHRLCVHPDYQHRGIARTAMLHIEEQAKKLGTRSIRLDVFTLNTHALHLYEGLGYNRVGIVTWRKGSFYLMEKHLNHLSITPPINL
jgi:ribosomal protein S18 acetylase RimI-like enzyme